MPDGSVSDSWRPDNPKPTPLLRVLGGRAGGGNMKVVNKEEPAKQRRNTGLHLRTARTRTEVGRAGAARRSALRLRDTASKERGTWGTWVRPAPASSFSCLLSEVPEATGEWSHAAKNPIVVDSVKVKQADPSDQEFVTFSAYV